ncbi:MAG: T9SS type A sorting domain-containing protein, partial [Lentimicrobium sp.]|nr:T9SS type A sorting domain-containing protein [Lentimicrobium sp.]
ITDLSGKTVLEDSFSVTLIYRINLSNLPRGIYLMRASNSESQIVNKLIVQ